MQERAADIRDVTERVLEPTCLGVKIPNPSTITEEVDRRCQRFDS
ncbi:MAG: hypothetical protein V9E84_01210 [Trichococcus flocculiformis]